MKKIFYVRFNLWLKSKDSPSRLPKKSKISLGSNVLTQPKIAEFTYVTDSEIRHWHVVSAAICIITMFSTNKVVPNRN